MMSSQLVMLPEIILILIDRSNAYFVLYCITKNKIKRQRFVYSVCRSVTRSVGALFFVIQYKQRNKHQCFSQKSS